MNGEKTYFCAIKTNSMETKQLKFYKVFLASSNELSDDRKHFFLYKDKVNKIIEKFGYQIQVERWEITDPAFPSGRGQDEYNKLLKDCDECIVLFWKKRGNFSEEELDVAYEGFKNGEKPNRLTVYFKEVEEKYVEPDLIEFKKDFLKKYGERFYSSYRGIEGVESDFLLFFIGKNLPAAQLSIQDSKIMLDGQELGNVSNLSLAYNNKPYQKLSKEVSDLEKDLLSLKTSNPESSSIPLLEKQLSEKKKELQNFEKALMEMAQTITRITTADPDDKRVALAQKEFEEGNYHKALDILNRKEILAEVAQCDKDFESAKELTDKAKEKYRAKIETIVLRIQYLSVAKVKNWVSECKELYEEAVFHARKCYTDPELVDLLFKQARFLQVNNQFADSQYVYEEVLEKYQKLAEATPETYLLDVAYTLGNLGLLHKDTGKYAEAEKEFSEILTIFRKLAEDSPEAYLPYVAQTLNNLGALHYDTGKHGDAEKEYGEALEKYRKLAESNPETYLLDVAGTLFNMALLRMEQGKLSEATQMAQESLEKYQTMAKLSPAAFNKDVEDAKNLLEEIRAKQAEKE